MRYVSVVIVLCVAVVFGTARAPCYATPSEPVVVLLIVDGLAWGDLDWSESSVWRKLAYQGSIGVANVRPITSGQVVGSGHLTLGAGHKRGAGPTAGLAFMANESFVGTAVPDLYASFTAGRAMPHIVHLPWAGPAAVEDDAGQQRTHTLGGAISAAGLAVWALGNADTWEGPGRYGVLAAMDDAGAVSRGDVGRDTLLVDPAWPFLWRTDYGRLLALVTEAMAVPGLVVVELGDLLRLDAAMPWLTATITEHSRRVALAYIFDFIEHVMAAAGHAALPVHLLVVSPIPAPASRADGLITPIVHAMFGDETGLSVAGGGLLMSPTTRRPGIVVDADVAPTVLSLFGLDYGAMAGRPFTVVPAVDAPEQLDRVYRAVTRVHRQRLGVIQPYFYLQLVAICLATAVLLWGRRWLPLAVIGYEPLAITFAAMMVWPLVVLLLPLVPGELEGTALAACLVLLTACVVALGWLAGRGNVLRTLSIVNAVVVVVLLYDGLTGAALMQRSHFGYDVLIGARFYGMGNEYMGLLLGSAAMAAGGVLDMVAKERRQMWRYAIAVVMGAIVFMLASPAHGANVGGTIGAVCCFGAVLLLLGRYKPRWKHVVFVALILMAVLGAAVWYDVRKQGAHASHLGRFAEQLAASRGGALWPTVERKMAMNMRLIRVTVWGRAFVVSLLASLYFTFWLPPTWRPLAETYPHTMKAMQGAVIGALAVLAANDSGIVAAAMLMIPVVSVLLTLSLCHWARDHVETLS